MESSDDRISDDLPFCFKRGTDQRAVTCRAKLQSRRCKLNQEINKELRLRAGAENLYKATINRKMKDTIALELSFVNSNLQLLKEKLSELNSSVEVYQHESVDSVMPMIPLGLKETKEVNFMEPFSDFILEHYSEASEAYQDAIADIADTRQAARTPSRDPNGLSVLFKYYNLLYFVERRFFPPDRTLGIYFEWYDSLTGVPSCQRTVAFEKACILFNLGGVYTQIGTKQDRRSESGLDAAVENFLRAAGVFKHILETFTNAPSMDLKPQVLQIIVSLMLAQARECLFEKLLLQLETHIIDDDYHIHKDLSREAAQLMTEYHELHAYVRNDDIQSYIPECWTGFVPLKSEYYKALAHYHASKSICCDGDDARSASRREDDNSVDISSGSQHEMSLEELTQSDPATATAIKMAHIKESLACHEETQRLQRMCRDLRNKISLSKMLNEAYLRTVCETEALEQTTSLDSTIIDNDSIDIHIPASSKFTLSLIGPDFTANKVNDPFQKLGPIAIFSARRHWTAPRSIRLQKGSPASTCRLHHYSSSSKRIAPGFRHNMDTNSSQTHQAPVCTCSKDNRKVSAVATSTSAEYGFHMRGDAPVIVCSVDVNSLADLGGIKEGDFIVELDGIDVKWYTNVQIATLIQASGSSLDLKVITPMDRNYLKSTTSSAAKQVNGGSISARSLGSSSGVSSGTSSPVGTSSSSKTKLRSSKSSKGRLSTLSTSWNPFRRTQSLGKIF